LQWVKLRIDEGMQTSQAIRALQHLEREGAELSSLLTPQAPQSAGSLASLEMLRQHLLDSLMAHDAETAGQVLSDALALYPLEPLIFELLAPTFNAVGEAWSEGEINIATEHFATQYLRQHLLLWLRSGPPSYPVRPVVLACAPGELHEGSLLMLAVLLRRLRWPVVYLGQTLPLSDLAALVDEVDAVAVVLVAMTEEPARALAEWPRWLPRAAQTQHPVVGFGGRVFVEHPELVEQVPGVFLGRTLEQGIEALDRILRQLNPLPR
jgi:methanogenic corrinoid protein MtbC1